MRSCRQCKQAGRVAPKLSRKASYGKLALLVLLANVRKPNRIIILGTDVGLKGRLGTPDQQNDQFQLAGGIVRY